MCTEFKFCKLSKSIEKKKKKKKKNKKKQGVHQLALEY